MLKDNYNLMAEVKTEYYFIVQFLFYVCFDLIKWFGKIYDFQMIFLNAVFRTIFWYVLSYVNT